MFWSHVSEQKQDKQQDFFDEVNDRPTLSQQDFKKMIDLEQKYNYLKSLVKIQQLNHMNQHKNQLNMMKILTDLIEYYAMCVTEAESNVDTIIKYFQYKIKDLNAHFITVCVKQKAEEVQKSQAMRFEKNASKVKELGHIQPNFLKLTIPEPSFINQKQSNQTQRIIDIKKNLNQTLMIALQNQNIQEHFKSTNKKAQFLRKSIATTLQQQELMLQKRRQQGKKKKQMAFKNVKLSIANTLETASSNIERKILRRQFPKCTGDYYSSDSDLDQAESLYIENFTLQEVSSPFIQSKLSLMSPSK